MAIILDKKWGDLLDMKFSAVDKMISETLKAKHESKNYGYGSVNLKDFNRAAQAMVKMFTAKSQG